TMEKSVLPEAFQLLLSKDQNSAQLLLDLCREQLEKKQLSSKLGVQDQKSSPANPNKQADRLAAQG
ncbi:MAG: hypothetical protein MHPSP_003823, partial [Paramarteilia canceri]